jgi:Glyoxalase/Bleomycin resistance protein/Dioxygenase superfamily
VESSELGAQSVSTLALVAVTTVTPILNVSDVCESVAWFEQLGWRQGFLWSGDDGEIGFGSVVAGREAEIFLCRDGQGSRDGTPSKFPFDSSTGCVWMSWFLDSAAEVDELHALACRLGLEVTMAPTDEPWGVREFHLRHPDGHTFRIGARSSS